MTAPTTADALAFAHELADAADVISMRYYRTDIGAERKADGTLVTVADRETEAELRRLIGGRFPEHSILGEEAGYSAGGEGAARWILDPIDGTHSYARGIPIWGTLIALERDGTVEVGVASAPALGTRWWAGRGLGAYRAPLPFSGAATDGERIHVSEVASLSEAQVFYGSYRQTLDAWGGRTVGLLRDTWRNRSFSDFWGHCLVAEGSAEVMIEAEIAWDIAAMLVIVEEAGGRLTDLEGNATIDAGHCVTSNDLLHDDVRRRLRG